MSWANAARACLARTEGQTREGHQRWHFQQGPIDLIIGVNGDTAVIDVAIERAWARFATVLEELVAELKILKTAVPMGPGGPLAFSETSSLISNDDVLPKPRAPTPDRLSFEATNSIPSLLKGVIAQKMYQYCAPYGLRDHVFVTPMAAVAGCVAQEIIGFLQEPGIRKSWVNNGGDIAWYAPVGSDQTFSVGIPGLPVAASLSLSVADQYWGVATSGWRGRSQSLGIADSVTVIARNAGLADVAATLIANQVCLQPVSQVHPEIIQKPAHQVKDQSDLGDLLVTVAVGALTEQEICSALDSGERYAQTLRARDWIQGAVLCLKGQIRVCGGFNPIVQGGSHLEVQVSGQSQGEHA
jgi:uncharacterized protein